MTTKESFRERQENELEVLQSIFGNDCVDLRLKNTSWKPLDIKIKLTPQKGSSGGQEVYTITHLHIICLSKYPKVPPKIILEESKGLSDILIDQLTKDLEKQANDLKGEVMIFELAQTVQTFLHKHNKPPAGSFYDEMLLQKLKRDEDLRNINLVKENQMKKNIRDEVLRRTEILRNESKVRKHTRRSISESSPIHHHHHHNKSDSTSDSSDGITPYFRSHMYPNECTEHRTSDVLYFSNVGRKIQKGCCVGHSQKGCVAYSGIDLETGQLLYITEWNVKHAQLEQKCILNCNRTIGDVKCNGHSTDEIISSIERQVINLAQLRHKNLIGYECVLCMKKKEGIVIYLVQDFVLGTSVWSISARLGWCAEGASMVARGVLDALIFLHNKGVSHSLLFDTTVFMDNCGTIRITDFALVPYLQELIGEQKFTFGDLPALGALIESLTPTPPSEMRDFIEKCKSERTLSASDLLEHPFLRPVLFQEHNIKDNKSPTISDRPMPTLHPMCALTPVTSVRSRIQTEFEVLQFIGKGAFGDVLKVRNILDNGQYAIKRIPLSSRNRQLYKKMTREVELLSRLNHENVVRYFNSWIESANINEDKSISKLDAGDWSVSHESRNPSSHVKNILDDLDDSSESDWLNCMPHPVDSSSDGIEFVNSKGEIIELQSDEEPSLADSDEATNSTSQRKPLLQYMYIQMEFCEKSTLRTAIDGGLYSDFDRLWRFFREIVEGLSHIHQQGMIHRDLKPVNIFIDSRDQVKIGDFGLATTSFLALQSQEQNASHNLDMSDTLTGKVGTALYVAPELTDNAFKSTYNQKVDLYSLGIMLFEMSFPPISTGMERIQILSALRTSDIIIPQVMLSDPSYNNNIQVIRWLLNHDPSERPTAEELLISELVPPAKLEANELQEMLRHALANPQSKAYKHLITRCLDQQSEAVIELTYHMGLVPISSIMEYIKNKITNLFRKHGAVEVVTPLLTPYSKNGYIHNNSVRLMTHSGNVVYLPHDLRIPFARHVALNGINLLRRYSVGRIYREKKVFNFHPKQLYECAFDIITPNPGNLLVDAELLSIAYEITNELPILRQKNISIRINHTTLLRAILVYCNIPINKYKDLFAHVLDYMDRKISKFQLQTSLNAIMQTSKQSSSTLLDLLQTEYSLGGPKGTVNETNLRHILRGRGEAASLAKGAIRELESVVSLAQGLGVSCPINLHAGLPIGYDRAKTGGIVWQMLAEEKPGRQSKRFVLAAGGRYDTILAEFQKSAHQSGFNIPEREISGAGFSFSLDKLIYTIGNSHAIDCCSTVDVVVCVTGSRPPLKDVTQILRSLWAAGIRCGIVESVNSDEAQDMAKDLGAAHIVLLGEGGALRVRSWEHERFIEHHVARPELIDSLQRLLKTDSCISDLAQQNYYSTNQPISRIASSNSLSFPTVHIIVLTNEKTTTNMRRRYEAQLKQQMTSTFLLFEKKEKITVVAVDLPGHVIGALSGAIDPREFTTKTDDQIKYVSERFSRHKKYILEIYDELIDLLSERRNPSIIGLYSITDFCYRIIL